MAANTKAVFMPQRPIYYCSDSTSRSLKYHLDQMISIINRCNKNLEVGSTYTKPGAAIDFKLNEHQTSFGLGAAWCSGTVYFQNLNYDYPEVASAIAFSIDKFYAGKFYKLDYKLYVQWKEVVYFDRMPR